MAYLDKIKVGETTYDMQDTAAQNDIAAHEAETDNPHSVTKSQVGLGNVDNTSDANKPISTATQNALNLKANAADLTSHVNNHSNPHAVTKAQVGLGNVDNTSDVNKPISTATQTALDEIDEELASHSSRIAHLDEIKADRAVLQFLDRRADYIYRHNEHQEYNIEAHPTSSESAEAYSRALGSGVQGVIPKTFGGKTVAVNQLETVAATATKDSAAMTWTKTNNNYGTLTILGGTYTSSPFVNTGRANIIASHKYLFRVNTNLASDDVFSHIESFRIRSEQVSSSMAVLYKSNVESGGKLFTAGSDEGGNGWIRIQRQTSTTEDWTSGNIYTEVIDLTQWFGAGNEPSTVAECYTRGIPREFIPYNAGQLRSADVSRVASNSKNLYAPYNYSKTQYGINFATLLDGTITVNGTSTGTTVSAIASNPIAFAELEPGTYAVSGKSGSVNIQAVTENNVVLVNTSSGSTFTITGRERVYLRAIISSGVTANNIVIKPQLEKASSPTSYSPPGAISLLTIPTQLRSEHPLHSAGEAYDEYDLDRMIFKHNNKKIVNLGSFTWLISSAYSSFYVVAPTDIKIPEQSSTPNVTTIYPSAKFTSIATTDKSIFVSKTSGGEKRIYIKDSSYTLDLTGAAALKAALNGVMCTYELDDSEKEEIPISSYFADIDIDSARTLLAESGGTVTFEQTTPSGEVALELPVPNTLDYLVNVPQAAENL